MKEHFIKDDRLGIQIPAFSLDWEQLAKETQHFILFQWEKIRGHIPDRIAVLETEINKKQAELSNEYNFERSCKLNSEIAELASIINDLWLWYRTNQSVSEKIHM